MNGLTQKQEDFTIHYFKTGNATQSAILAGYSKNTAHEIGYENLNKPDIQARLQALRDKTETTAIADVRERKQILSDIMRIKPHKESVTASQINQAIDISNKMDRIYLDQTPREGEVYNTFVFVMPDGSKIEPDNIIEGKVIDAIDTSGETKALPPEEK